MKAVPAAKPAEAPVKAAAAPATEAPAGPEYVTLRGPSAAVAKNMNASLELPTATSVRAVPVKLLFDNRIVINNHLKRARGGRSPSRTSSGTRWCRPSRPCRR